MNTASIAALVLLVCSAGFLLFPPAFGSRFFGLRIPETLADEASWKWGQTIYALGLGLLGLIFGGLGMAAWTGFLPFPVPGMALIFILSYVIIKKVTAVLLRRRQN
jgi:hypothetical protein